ncbi:MAG: glutaminyl-tRNA synthetase, partial [Bermanella sp.]
YDRLFLNASPDKGEGDFLDHINPESKRVLENCWIEPGLANAAPETCFQFEREGYFVADRLDHTTDAPVFNMTIGLRDTFSDKAGGR